MASSSQRPGGANTPDPFEAVPLTLHIGAEIRGVDLAHLLPDDQVKAMRDAAAEVEGCFRPRPKPRSHPAGRHGAPVR